MCLCIYMCVCVCVCVCMCCVCVHVCVCTCVCMCACYISNWKGFYQLTMSFNPIIASITIETVLLCNNLIMYEVLGFGTWDFYVILHKCPCLMTMNWVLQSWHNTVTKYSGSTVAMVTSPT